MVSPGAAHAPRGRLAVVFLTIFVDLVGFGIVLPILPFYAQRFGAEGLGFGVVVGVFSAMQFLANVLLGRLSDRVGRRPVLLATIAVNVLGYLLFAAANSYAVLLAARMVSGFASGNIAVAQAYVADVTTGEHRSKGMGMIGAAFGLGFVVGPALGGLASHYAGHAAPGLLAAALCGVNLASAWLILPESLHHELRTQRELWPFGHIAHGLRDHRLRPLMILWLLAPLAFAGYTVALPLWASATLGWREKELGLFFTLVGVVAAVVQGWLVGRLAPRVGDRALVVSGTFGMAVAIAAVPFTSSTASLLGWTVVLAFTNSIMAPAATGMTSVYSDPTEQGAMLGTAQSLAALGRLSGPEVMGTVYDVATPTWSFLVAGLIMLAAAVATLRLSHERLGATAPAPPPI